jgi:hypothetical protein
MVENLVPSEACPVRRHFTDFPSFAVLVIDCSFDPRLRTKPSPKVAHAKLEAYACSEKTREQTRSTKKNRPPNQQ